MILNTPPQAEAYRSYAPSLLQIYLLKHDIHIKLKSYKLELLGEWSFNMVSELGLAGGPGFESSPCKFNPHVYLKVHNGL